MRYCHNCHKTTTGEPLFCHFCASTYDAKLCPARHINPRWAQVCSQCGSRDLSTPAPPVPWWLRPLLLAASLVPGLVLLLLLVMVVVAVIKEVLSNQAVQAQLLALVVVLALLWWLYLQLPHLIQNIFRSLWRKPKKTSILIDTRAGYARHRSFDFTGFTGEILGQLPGQFGCGVGRQFHQLGRSSAPADERA